MKIDIELIKDLRVRTNAGVLECKRALEEALGDIERATELLRERGVAIALKRATKVANEGVVEAYIHTDKRVGALVEVNCETDFVAKTEEFRIFVKDICMQVAAMEPRYMSRADVPEAVVEREKEILVLRARKEGKPEEAIDGIVEGRLENFYANVCLLDQAFIKDEKLKISDILNEKIAKFGEKIVIRRFARFRVGDETFDYGEAKV